MLITSTDDRVAASVALRLPHQTKTCRMFNADLPNPPDSFLLAIVPISSGNGRWRRISSNHWAADCQSPTRARAERAALQVTCDVGCGELKIED